LSDCGRGAASSTDADFTFFESETKFTKQLVNNPNDNGNDEGKEEDKEQGQEEVEHRHMSHVG